MRVIPKILQDQITATVRFKYLLKFTLIFLKSRLILTKIEDYLQTVDSVAEFDLRHLGTSRFQNRPTSNNKDAHHELSSDSDHDHVSLQDHSDLHTIVEIHSKPPPICYSHNNFCSVFHHKFWSARISFNVGPVAQTVEHSPGPSGYHTSFHKQLLNSLQKV